MKALTFNRLVVALTFLAIFAMAARVAADTDTWWHLRTGQWIVAHGAIPQTDPFSHTRAGADWRIPGWIVQVPLYWLFANFGYAGLNVFTAALVTLTFALVYPACSGPPLLRAFALVLAATVSGIYWSARPQLASLVLAAAFALILYRWRRPRSPAELAGGAGSALTLSRQERELWLLPPLMALWANAHGGFAIGFILLALTFAGEALKFGWAWWSSRNTQYALRPSPRPLLYLLGISLLCALAVALNPAGPERLWYPFKTVGIGALREFIQEWQSPNFHALEQQVFLWLLLATFAVVALSRRPVDVTDLVLVCGVAYLGFLAGRNVPLLAVVAPPLLTRHAAGLLAPSSDDRPAFAGNALLNWVLLVVLALAAMLKVFTVLPTSANERAIAKVSPVGAAEFIRRERPPGPMFNSYNFGGYLMWALYPEYPVFVDGRTDLYDDAFLREYLRVALGRPGYEAMLDRYGVRLVVIEADSLLGDRLSENPRWRELYRDDVAAVYGRNP
ncbi:MAG: hypothetical protein RMK99_04915 [Anaerolineales bacterium]|nr:hypothetical protein [Anaerolineales bacterium]